MQLSPSVQQVRTITALRNNFSSWKSQAHKQAGCKVRTLHHYTHIPQLKPPKIIKIPRDVEYNVTSSKHRPFLQSHRFKIDNCRPLTPVTPTQQHAAATTAAGHFRSQSVDGRGGYNQMSGGYSNMQNIDHLKVRTFALILLQYKTHISPVCLFENHSSRQCFCFTYVCFYVSLSVCIPNIRNLSHPTLPSTAEPTSEPPEHVHDRIAASQRRW